MLIALGLIVLMFAGYQLWGTGLHEGRAQASLEDDFEARKQALAELGNVTTTAAAPTTTVPNNDGAAPSTTAPAPNLPVSIAPALAAELEPIRGESMGEIRIPAIDVRKQVISGVGRDDLRRGPGHYPSTPMPGQAGNAAIAGHRTTYGQPFHNLDLLEPGDTIEVETLQGTFYYEVMGHPNAEGDQIGHFIVEPTRTDVVDYQGDNRLTLTACHPKYSARQRIVVTALMVGAPAPSLPTTTAPSEIQLGADEDDPEFAAGGSGDGEDEGNTVGIEEESLEESLGWHYEELNITLVWSAFALLVAFAGWLLGRAWKKWPAYAIATPVFFLVLFVTFGHLDRMLPAL